MVIHVENEKELQVTEQNSLHIIKWFKVLYEKTIEEQTHIKLL